MKHFHFLRKHCVAVLGTGVLLCSASLALAQNTTVPAPTAPPATQTTVPQTTVPPNMPAPVPDQDKDRLARWQVANFDSFLDNHPELAEQLRKDPSLIDNQKFVDNHAALKDYLQQHPEIRETIDQNPNGVMHQENRYDRSGDSDMTRRELADMDAFMDKHPEIAEQLKKDPSLVDNKQFVANHPALQQFLASHPGVAEEYKEKPNAFMRQEDRFDNRENRRDNDVTHRELANMDRFMDGHPEIAEQLKKDPSLVDNKQFVANHPALQEFLANHPGVSAEYKENPNAFMQQENHFDRREDRRDSDVTRGELASFNEFLGGHTNIAGELEKNPSLATNKEYLENHSALQDYLKAHPQVHEELSENPQQFVKSAEQFNTATPAAGTKVAHLDPKSK